MDLTLEYNHIALLQHRAKNCGNTVLFKLPILRGSEPSQEWNNMTVAEFAAEVDRVASFLMTKLTARGIPNRSVVTLLWVFFFFVFRLTRRQSVGSLAQIYNMSYTPSPWRDCPTFPRCAQ